MVKLRQEKMKNEVKIGILRGFEGAHLNYVKACQDLNVNYEIVDIVSSDWINNIKNSSCAAFLVWTPCVIQEQKRMFDERLYFIVNHLEKIIYPSYEEILLHENKRNMAYWLDIHNFKHAKNWIFYDKQEALKFIDRNTIYPLVFKTNSGASASGVKILNNGFGCKYYIYRMFGLTRYFKRGIYRTIRTKIKIGKCSFILRYPLFCDPHQNYIIFQEYIPSKWEWRIIKIGDSYFGHQKLKRGKSFSGSDRVGWVAPPLKLLNLVKSICDTGNFRSMAVDVFESENGEYYINELQSLFGSYLPSQMYINGIPGRYVYKNSKWVFGEGEFNINGSCNLRVKDLLFLLSKISNRG